MPQDKLTELLLNLHQLVNELDAFIQRIQFPDVDAADEDADEDADEEFYRGSY